jgi:ubiquinone/menaquinone biosynthesis C-methylase UbiE
MFHPEGPTFLELMRQALVSTERGYDLIAPKFDRTPFRTPDPVLASMAELVGPPQSIRSALDVCCGTGAAMLHLRPLCTERLVGIDFSTGMLAEAARRLEVPGEAAPEAASKTSRPPEAPRIELVRGDALELPYEDEMDVVTSVGAFGHVLAPDEERFVAGIVRALRPGGRFVFATGRPPSLRDPWFWMAHGFNAVMRVRNTVWRPEFIMYYLTFLWPKVRGLLERQGLRVTLHEGRCPPPYERVLLVSAEKPR